MSEPVVIVDVRPDLREGRPPFERLMAAVEALEPGQDLCVIAPVDPVPLKQLLTRRGFAHQSRTLPSGDWEVLFQRRPAPAAPTAAGGAPRSAKPAGEVIPLDARGLEPPQPMVRILETLSTLPPGTTLAAHTDRRPMHLFAMLAERGYTAESQAQDDDSFITFIRRG